MAYKIKGDVEITRGTGLGVMTTAQRTTYTPAAAGYTVFDSTVGAEYSWDGAAWNVKAGLEARGTVTSDADAGEGIYNLDASGAAFHFTLPAATGSQKRRILLGEVFGNDVTVAVQSGETLNLTVDGTQVINTVGDVWYAIDRATGVWDLYQANGVSDPSRTLETITQAAHGFVVTQPVYHNGTDWQPAQADVDTTTAQAVVTKVVDVNNFEITTHGVATVTGHGLTVGEYYWLNQTAQAVTATQTTTGISQGLLHVRDANTLFIDVEQAVTVSAATTVQAASVLNTTITSWTQSTLGTTMTWGSSLTWADIEANYEWITILVGTSSNSSQVMVHVPSVQTLANYGTASSVVIATSQTGTNAVSLYLKTQPTDTTFSVGLVGLGVSGNLDVYLRRPQQTVIPNNSLVTDDQSTSGYMDFGAMRMQWGTVPVGGTSGQAITFPAPFLNTSYSITGTNDTSSTTARTVSFGTKTTTTAQSGRFSGFTGTTDFGFSWIATGLKP